MHRASHLGTETMKQFAETTRCSELLTPERLLDTGSCPWGELRDPSHCNSASDKAHLRSSGSRCRENNSV